MRIAILSILTCCCCLNAAEVKLVNGQVITGEIIEKNDKQLVMSVRVANSEAKVGFQLEEIESIDDQVVVPADPIAEESDQGPGVRLGSLGTSGNNNYEVIEIRGAIGEDIFAEAIHHALSRAKSRKVGTVVFLVDSNAPGSIDEARSIGRVLKRFQASLKIHAIIKECRGPALVIPLMANSSHFMPGSTLTGLAGEVADIDDEEATMLADLAYRAAGVAESRGKSPDLVRALINPADTVAVWSNAEGVTKVGPVLPDGVAADQVILENDDQTILELTADMLTKAGIATVASVPELGTALGLANWTKVDEGIAQVYTGTVERTQKEADKKETKLEKDIKRLTDRRESAQQVLEHSVERAKEVDPRGGSYSTKTGTTGSNTRLVGVRGARVRNRYRDDYGDNHSTYDTHRFTSDSEREWELRTQQTMRYVNDASKAVNSLASIERSAERKGIERIYSDEDLDLMKKDLREWQNRLAQEANRKGN